jgi:hypothetical protein
VYYESLQQQQHITQFETVRLCLSALLPPTGSSTITDGLVHCYSTMLDKASFCTVCTHTGVLRKTRLISCTQHARPQCACAVTYHTTSFTAVRVSHTCTCSCCSCCCCFDCALREYRCQYWHSVRGCVASVVFVASYGESIATAYTTATAVACT